MNQRLSRRTCNGDLSTIDLFCAELVRCGLPGLQQISRCTNRVTDTDRRKDRAAFALIAHNEHMNPKGNTFHLITIDAKG